MARRELTYEFVVASSKQFSSRFEFQKGDKASYNKALKNGWIDSFLWLGTPLPHKNDSQSRVHCVYAYIDEDNKYVYVGRTNNISVRHRQHNRKDRRNGNYDIVRRYFVESGLFCRIPKPIILEDNLNMIESQEKEDFYVQKYKNEGWNLLNSAKTGANVSALGSFILKWNYETCHDIALTCSSRKEFQRKNASAYHIAKSRGWIEDWLPISGKYYPKNTDWTEELCTQIARKYTSLPDFCREEPRAYSAAKKRGWIKKFTWLKHGRRDAITEDEIRMVASEFLYKSDFKDKYPSHYTRARQLNILNSLGFIPKPSKWTYDTCKAEASKYKTQIEFRRANSTAFYVSWKNGWVNDWLPRTHIYRTDDELLQEVSKFKTITELRKINPSLHNLLLDRGLLEKSGLVHSLHLWNDEAVANEAAKYPNRTEFRKGCEGAYKYACRHQLLDKLFPRN